MRQASRMVRAVSQCSLSTLHVPCAGDKTVKQTDMGPVLLAAYNLAWDLDKELLPNKILV